MRKGHPESKQVVVKPSSMYRSLNTVAESAMTLQVSLQHIALDVVASCMARKSVIICCEERRLFARLEGADGPM